MYAKTTTLFTTTILSLVFYGLSTSPVLAKLSPGSSQGIPSNADTKVGLSETERLKALNQRTDISQGQAEPSALPALPAPEPPASTVTPPPEPPASTVTPASTETTAQTETTASLTQNVPGIINSFNGTSVEMKLADGTFKSFQLSPDLVIPSTMAKGEFVNLRVKDQIVQEVQPAEVESTIEGTVREINGSQVTMESADGSLTTTTVAPEVAKRMGLAQGTRLVVTSYRGIGSTKLCFGKTTPVALPPVRQQTPPPKPTPRPRAVPALW